MALGINTNVASLSAQNQLQKSQDLSNQALERLSSGLRINSAKDDAAGLAIAERFSTQIRGLDVAARNANDGISLAQTAEGAMVEIGNNLQRIRELAVQSSNATNSASDREALQAEVDQLTSEVDRVASQTDFNGTKLLDGSFNGKSFQVGANAGQLISINSVANAKADTLGGTFLAEGTIAASVPTDPTVDYTLTDVTVNGTNIGTLTVAANSGTAAEMQTAMAEKISAAINDNAAEIGVAAEVDADVAGQVNVKSIEGSDTATAITYSATAANGTVTGTFADPTAKTKLEDVDISSFLGSQQALAVMDEALTEINSSRADMGAVQNRFDSVISNLQTTSENLSASRGRILDADFAAETAKLSKSQVLQQAGISVLAQANARPQQVLSLLQ
ncbi:flagellin [uncultured Marinobacter sp.]|uniref:flagellin n=1 Tax=uncultured Marinobacter sp. TaxID=187379 RepID=UPI0026297852|nr:flagellin [uncultured Marinobacter sp.]